MAHVTLFFLNPSQLQKTTVHKEGSENKSRPSLLKRMITSGLKGLARFGTQLGQKTTQFFNDDSDDDCAKTPKMSAPTPVQRKHLSVEAERDDYQSNVYYTKTAPLNFDDDDDNVTEETRHEGKDRRDQRADEQPGALGEEEKIRGRNSGSQEALKSDKTKIASHPSNESLLFELQQIPNQSLSSADCEELIKELSKKITPQRTPVQQKTRVSVPEPRQTAEDRKLHLSEWFTETPHRPARFSVLSPRPAPRMTMKETHIAEERFAPPESEVPQKAQTFASEEQKEQSQSEFTQIRIPLFRDPIGSENTITCRPLHEEYVAYDPRTNTKYYIISEKDYLALKKRHSRHASGSESDSDEHIPKKKAKSTEKKIETLSYKEVVDKILLPPKVESDQDSCDDELTHETTEQKAHPQIKQSTEPADVISLSSDSKQECSSNESHEEEESASSNPELDDNSAHSCETNEGSEQELSSEHSKTSDVEPASPSKNETISTGTVFHFGSPSNSNTTPTFSFGTNTEKNNSVPTFNFGTSDEKKDSAPAFSFGTSDSKDSVPAFNFGTNDEKKDSTPAFSFGTNTEKNNSVPTFNFGTNDEKKDSTSGFSFNVNDKKDSVPAFSFGKNNSDNDQNTTVTSAPEEKTSDSSKAGSGDEWKCLCCETVNTGDVCTVCCVPKPSKSDVEHAKSLDESNKSNTTSTSVPAFTFGASDEKKDSVPAFNFGTNDKKDSSPTFSFGKNNSDNDQNTTVTSAPEEKTSDSSKAGSGDEWKCLCCETVNTGDVCTVCCVPKPSKSDVEHAKSLDESNKSNTTSTSVPAFTFGASDEKKDSTPAFTFGVSDKKDSAPAFSFGTSDEKKDSTPALSFGTNTEKNNSVPTFNFGASDEKKDTVPAFSFGASDSKKDSVPAFSFGTSDEKKDSAPAFSFGTSDSKDSVPAFNFGTNDEKKDSTPAFSFGTSTEKNNSVPTFNFGASDEKKDSAPAFSFGTSDKNDSAPAFTFGTK